MAVKVLILHQHFKSPNEGGAIRSYYLARALVDRNFKVTVITTHNQRVAKVENIEGIEVHYLPIAYDNRFGFSARVIAFIRYVWGAVRLAEKFKDFDCCYAISVPLTVGIAAMRIKNKYGMPFLFEVGDLWPDAPIQLGFIKNFFVTRALYGLEKRIYRAAAAVVALSPAIREVISKRVLGKKVHVITNMADCDFFKPEKKRPELEEKFQTREKFVISYVGAVGMANGLDFFLECANACRKAGVPARFLLCGDGALLERLQRNANHLNLTNLSFIPFTNRAGVKEVLNVTDAVLVCYKPVAILETGSPNKFFDGLAAGKLILANFGGWICREIEANQCGVFVDPHQPEAFVKKISPFITDTRLLIQHQEAARALAEKKYSRNLLGEQFGSLFKSMPKHQHAQ